MDKFKITPRQKNEDVKLVSGESAELYELKCLNRTDVNMIRARRWFDRPAYHTKFMEGKDNGIEEG